MNDSLLTALLGLTGVIVGALIQVFSANFQIRKTSELTTKNNNLERRRSIHDETLRFEHLNLLEVQDLLIEHTRFVIGYIFEDRKSLIITKKLSKFENTAHEEEARITSKKLSLTISRVLDEDLRVILEHYVGTTLVSSTLGYVEEFKKIGPKETLKLLDQLEKQIATELDYAISAVGRNIRATVTSRNAI